MGDIDNERTISSRAHVGISVTSIAGLIVGFGLFLYAQMEEHKRETREKFEERATECAARWDIFEKRLDVLDHNKAEKKDAADRYTGTVANERDRAVDQRFSSNEKADAIRYESIQRQIEHVYDMIEALQP